MIVVGPWEPTTDLAQTIISDVKPELLVKHTNNLVTLYWERLFQLGVSDKEYSLYFSFFSLLIGTHSAYVERYCQGGPERWIWLFVVIAS